MTTGLARRAAGDAEAGAEEPGIASPSSRLTRFLFPLLLAAAFLCSQISPAYVLLSLLALCWTIDAVGRRRIPESLRSPLTIAFAVHAGLVALSAVFSQNPTVSARHLPGLLLFLLVPVGIDVVDRVVRAERVTLALAAGGILLGLLGLWQFAHGGDDLNNRIRGTLSHYMTFSGLTMIAGCLLLGFLLEERGGRRWIGALAVVPLAAMLLTYTRNAYVGTVAALIVLLAVRRPKKLLLLVPAIALVFLLAPADVRARIRSIADLEDPTNRDRIAMVHAGARMIAERPLFGVGPDMVKPLYPRYRDPDAPRARVPHLHDNVVQIAAASGLPAAAAYAVAVALFVVRVVGLLRRERRPLESALLAGCLLAGTAVTVAGFFEYNFGDTEVLMATLLVFGLPFSRALAPSNAAVPP